MGKSASAHSREESSERFTHLISACSMHLGGCESMIWQRKGERAMVK